jgi:hypothetical protein
MGREKLDVGADVVYPPADQFYCEPDRGLRIPTDSKGFPTDSKGSLDAYRSHAANAEARDHLRAGFA